MPPPICLSSHNPDHKHFPYSASAHEFSIAIATQVSLDLIEGEQAYRRGCEYLYGTNGFGLRGEGIAKTLALSLLKQSADMGNSDRQYRYGRCLLRG
jgi:TPR repeat protein